MYFLTEQQLMGYQEQYWNSGHI